MFKKRAAVFYRSIKTQGVAKCFYSDKTQSMSLGSPKKRFKLWGENISIQEKQAMPYQNSLYILSKLQIVYSHASCQELCPVTIYWNLYSKTVFQSLTNKYSCTISWINAVWPACQPWMGLSILSFGPI